MVESSVCCLRKSSGEVPQGSRTGAPGMYKQGPFFPIHPRSVEGQFILIPRRGGTVFPVNS